MYISGQFVCICICICIACLLCVYMRFNCKCNQTCVRTYDCSHAYMYTQHAIRMGLSVHASIRSYILCSLQNRFFPRIGRRIFAPRKLGRNIFAPRKRRMGLLGTRPTKTPKKVRGGERKQNCTFYGVNSMALKKNFKEKWKPTGTRLRHRVCLLGMSI